MAEAAAACPNCGELNGPQDCFCNSCGFPLQPHFNCLECRYPLMTQWKYCPACGSDCLPDGWIAAVDDSGEIYYVDEYNQKSQWEVPTEPVANLPADMKRATRNAGKQKEREAKSAAGGKAQEKKKGGRRRKKPGRSGMTMIDEDLKAVATEAAQQVAGGMQPMDAKRLAEFSLQNLVEKQFRLEGGGGAFKSKKTVSVSVIGKYEPYKARASWGCFLKINTKAKAEGNKIWRWVCSFMMERKSSKNKKTLIKELSIYSATKSSSIRDEIYCVLMKQLTRNQGPNGARAAGWQLMDAMLRRFPPSRDLQEYLQAFLVSSQTTNSTNSQISTFINWCLQSLSKIWGLGFYTLVQYSEKYYAKVTKYMAINQPISAEELLVYGKTLRQPLQKLKSDLRKPAAALFKAINRGVSKNNPQEAAQKIIKLCNDYKDRKELVDEAYCQCLKQICFPPQDIIAEHVATIMNIVLNTHQPSARFGQFMHTQILLNSKSSSTPANAQIILIECLQKIGQEAAR